MVPLYLVSLALVSLATTVSSSVLRRQTNDGISLAISPTCGTLKVPATTVSNVNAGLLPISSYKTIISFGDSYTAGGVLDGSTLAAPVVIPPNPKAGGRTTNGRVWIEDISVDTGALFRDYADGGAVVNKTLWGVTASDFVGQVKIFLSQDNTYSPTDTLYTVFFGINDVAYSKTVGDYLPQAAEDLVEQIKLLASPPTNARDFLITDNYGRGSESASGDAYKLQIYNALGALHKAGSPTLNFAFVDFAPLWTGILGTTPGYKAFGYTSSGYCVVNSSSTVGECADPEHTFYWISGHPSKETHRIMGNWVEDVLSSC